MHIFLDDGDVISDNQRRAAQWRRLLGEFFPPVLGGTAEDWQRANRVVASELLGPANWAALQRRHRRYVEYDRHYHLDWLRGMCDQLGQAAPSDEQACYELAIAATDYVTHRVDAAQPGVVATI